METALSIERTIVYLLAFGAIMLGFWLMTHRWSVVSDRVGKLEKALGKLVTFVNTIHTCEEEDCGILVNSRHVVEAEPGLKSVEITNADTPSTSPPPLEITIDHSQGEIQVFVFLRGGLGEKKIRPNTVRFLATRAGNKVTNAVAAALKMEEAS